MDISRVEGKGKQKGKGKVKGKSKQDSNSKGRGKKGRSNSGQDGKGKSKQHTQSDGRNSNNNCLYCGKPGHWKRDCRKLRHDRETGQVRQLEGGTVPQIPPPPPVMSGGAQQPGSQQPVQPTVSFVQPTPHTTYVQPQQPAGQVRRFEFAPMWSDDAPHFVSSMDIDDLTTDPIHDGQLCMLISNAVVDVGTHVSGVACDIPSCANVFDMTYSDDDGHWTHSSDSVGHIRAVEIILDSGADGSALPLSYASVGSPTSAGDKPRFVDAQGVPLNISSTRLATVDLGGFGLKEEFLIASITSPLLSLGRLMKHGWTLDKTDSGLYLTKGNNSIPVHYERNSLSISGTIRMLEDFQNFHLRAVQLNDSIQRVKTTWAQLGAQCYGVKTFRPCGVDVTLAPSCSLLWYRTVLVQRGGQWHLHEHNRFISDTFSGTSLTAALPEPHTVEAVITLGHAVECTPEQLGFSIVGSALGLVSPSSAVVAPQPVRNSSAQAGADVAIPMADDEPPVEEELVAGPDEIVIDGSRINSDSPLAVLKAACASLGVASNGNKAQIFKRLMAHLEHQDLLAAHSVKHKLSKELERPPNSPGNPPQPSEDEVREHNLVHIPFQPWCELCIAHKSRQDKRHREGHSTSEHSVVSFDFGYSSRILGSDDSLTMLCIHDRSTKLMHVVPTQSKGGRSLPYLTSELCRFVMWIGHQKVCLRTDNEPSTLALLDAARKALKGLGVHTTVEMVTPGNKEANGAAEVTVQTIRNQANLLTDQVERACGVTADKMFGANHAMYAWAVVHACWLHCRFAVSNGETAKERVTGRARLGSHAWDTSNPMPTDHQHGIGAPGLGRPTTVIFYIVSCNGGLFITKSVRRIPVPWILDDVEKVEITPWECSFATLGSRLSVPKRVMRPTPFPAQGLTPGSEQPKASDLDASSVGVKQTAGDEAASDPPTPAIAEAPLTPHAALPTIPEADDDGMEDASNELPGMLGQAGTPIPPRRPPPASAALAGPASPRQQSSSRPMEPAEDSESKRARICRIADGLEEYDFSNSDPSQDDVDSSDVDALQRQLMFPHSDSEPCLPADQLAELDEIADQVETMRLKAIGVLLPPETVEGSNPKRLSTRYVRTWRDKTLNGVRCWLRRSRYVAREYAWLSPDRQDLSSPASSNITNRLLPSIYLHLKHEHPEKQFVLSAVDIADAFLTVPQVQPTLVSSGSEAYALGRVLPGQRDGSQMWFDSVTGFLRESLGFEHCAAYPSLLRSAGGECLILLHVDDMLIVSEQGFFDEKLIPTITSRYKASLNSMRKAGDSFEFLKRIHVLVDGETIHVQQNPRHFEKLFEVVGIKTSMNPKKVPCHELMNEVDDTPALDTEKASRYRSAVGILLYLASDLVECAYTIRGLAQCMSAPTEKSWTMLKHLCLYLVSVRNHSLRLRIKPDGLWYSPSSEEGFVIELFSDPD